MSAAARASARVLLDDEHDEALRRDGYVIVPLLSPDEAEALRLAYHEQVDQPAERGGMSFEYMADDRQAMRQVKELLAPVWAEHLPRLFVDREVVFSTFVVKAPGDDSGMFLHDDRTFVDERVQRAFTVWVPLVDVSPELDNGTLYLVPGSHRIMPAASGTGTPDWIRPYERYFERHLQAVSMRAGQALVYDTKTLHGSTPNRTDRLREAIATAVAPSGAELIHVVADGDRRHVHRVDHDFFQAVHPASIERDGMPDRYPVVETYVEHRTTTSPEAVASVCDPDDVPVPEAVEVGPDGPTFRGIEPHDAADGPDAVADAASGAPSTVATATRAPSLVARLRRRLQRG